MQHKSSEIIAFHRGFLAPTNERSEYLFTVTSGVTFSRFNNHPVHSKHPSPRSQQCALTYKPHINLTKYPRVCSEKNSQISNKSAALVLVWHFTLRGVIHTRPFDTNNEGLFVFFAIFPLFIISIACSIFWQGRGRREFKVDMWLLKGEEKSALCLYKIRGIDDLCLCLKALIID